MSTRRLGTWVVVSALAAAVAGCSQTLEKLAKGEGNVATEAQAVVTALAKSGVGPKQVQVWERYFRSSKCDRDKPCAAVVVRGEGARAHITGVFLRGGQDVDLTALNKLSYLRTLQLSRNRITQLKGLAGLQRLTRVDLSRNTIQRVEGLHNLPRLRLLDLSGNRISEITGLKNLPALRRLRIGKNPLTAVRNLSNLGITELDFGKSRTLRTIANLSRLPRLRRILAKGGGLQTLELNDLPALETIDVRNNALTKLWLRNLRKLKTLGANRNRLQNEGLLLQSLPQLTHLGLDRNQLTAIPRVEGRTKLTWLSLKRNRIASLRGLERFRYRLKELFIDFNRLQTLQIEGWVKRLSMVRVVTLSADSNQLTSLEGIERFRYVRYLYLNRNKIASLKGIEQLRFLRKLQVGYNRLTTLKPLRIKGLQELVAKGNRIKSAPELFGPEHNRRPPIAYYDLRGNAFPMTSAVLLYYGRPVRYRGLYRKPVVWRGVRRTGSRYRYGRRSRSGRVGYRYSRGYRRWGK